MQAPPSSTTSMCQMCAQRPAAVRLAGQSAGGDLVANLCQECLEILEAGSAVRKRRQESSSSNSLGFFEQIQQDEEAVAKRRQFTEEIRRKVAELQEMVNTFSRLGDHMFPTGVVADTVIGELEKHVRDIWSVLKQRDDALQNMGAPIGPLRKRALVRMLQELDQYLANVDPRRFGWSEFLWVAVRVDEMRDILNVHLMQQDPETTALDVMLRNPRGSLVPGGPAFGDLPPEVRFDIMTRAHGGILPGAKSIKTVAELSMQLEPVRLGSGPSASTSAFSLNTDHIHTTEWGVWTIKERRIGYTVDKHWLFYTTYDGEQRFIWETGIAGEQIQVVNQRNGHEVIIVLKVLNPELRADSGHEVLLIDTKTRKILLRSPLDWAKFRSYDPPKFRFHQSSPAGYVYFMRYTPVGNTHLSTWMPVLSRIRILDFPRLRVVVEDVCTFVRTAPGATGIKIWAEKARIDSLGVCEGRNQEHNVVYMSHAGECWITSVNQRALGQDTNKQVDELDPVRSGVINQNLVDVDPVVLLLGIDIDKRVLICHRGAYHLDIAVASPLANPPARSDKISLIMKTALNRIWRNESLAVNIRNDKIPVQLLQDCRVAFVEEIDPYEDEGRDAYIAYPDKDVFLYIHKVVEK